MAEEPEGGFFNAIARGVDQTQAMMWGVVDALGELTGIDFIEEWGEEGVARNIEEMLKNPPKVERWDDVDSLSAFGNYVMERVGEQIPGFAGMLASGGIGSAVLGKAIKRKMGHKLWANYEKKNLAKVAQLRGMGDASYDAFRAAKTSELATRRAGLIGAGTFGVAQGTGETQMQLAEEGVEAPVAALLAGVSKGVIDTFGADRLLNAIVTTGRSPDSLLRKAAEVVKATSVSAGTEGVTEGIQTAIDQMTVAAVNGRPDYEVFDFDEIKESMIAGATVGGVLGGGASAIKMAMDTDAEAETLEDELDAMGAGAPGPTPPPAPPTPNAEQSSNLPPPPPPAPVVEPPAGPQEPPAAEPPIVGPPVEPPSVGPQQPAEPPAPVQEPEGPPTATPTQEPDGFPGYEDEDPGYDEGYDPFDAGYDPFDDVTDETPSTPLPKLQVSDEPLRDLNAQMRAMHDPSSAKDFLIVTGARQPFIPHGSEVRPIAVMTDQGPATVYTTNPEKAKRVKQSGVLTHEELNGELLYNRDSSRVGGKLDTDGTAVVAVTQMARSSIR